MTWKDVTVGQYQQLAEIGKMDLTDLEATQETIAILFGLTVNQVRQLKPTKLAAYVEQIGFLKTEIIPRRRTILYCKGYFYGVDYNFVDFVTSKYIESKYFMQDFVANIHNLLAVYTHQLKYGIIKKRPRISEFEKDAERLKAANIEEAMGVLVFFYPTFDNLMKIIQPYSELNKKTERLNNLIEKSVILSLNNTDGYTKPTLLANLRGFLWMMSIR
jgi:hypothetical protein